ncbi:hypothetical protein [Paraburkholderia acidipaludis]|uniref:hypothetical protein n=1 Tax=Paraburkholderia acidipaludis TaxID=660537 RepID=UPI00048304E6|nr:hypothetical protein [Paraburkholderia acidipaludis]
MATLKERGLFALAGMLLIAAAVTAPADAQIARPVGTSGTQSAAPLAPSTPPAGSASPQPMLYYVCGNPGIESQVTSPDPQHPFNLGVSFIAATNGAPLTNVSVKVRRHGRVLMDFVAAGPHCLFSVPDADYRIEGTYRGEMKFEIVQTGTMNAEIKW